MSPRKLFSSFKQTTIVFFFALYSILSSGPASALSTDSLDGVEVYTVSGTSITLQMGTLFTKEGFIPLTTQSGWECCIGTVSAADLAAIDGKPVIRLSLWTSFSSLSNGSYLSKFSRSPATYSIDSVPHVIVSVKVKSTPVAKDTAPHLNDISSEWNVEAGKPFTFPLSVIDAEDDDFMITSNLKDATFSAQYDLNQLPTVDFQWTPTDKQANKVFKVKFKAKETAAKKLVSKAVTTKIRVWPAGGQTDAASVSKFNVSTVRWHADVLTLAGKVVLNKIMSAEQRAAFLAKELDLEITAGNTGNGLALSSSPIPLKLSNNGNWSVTLDLPEAEVPCQVTLKYNEAIPATRTVKRAPKSCLK